MSQHFSSTSRSSSWTENVHGQLLSVLQFLALFKDRVETERKKGLGFWRIEPQFITKPEELSRRLVVSLETMDSEMLHQSFVDFSVGRKHMWRTFAIDGIVHLFPEKLEEKVIRRQGTKRLKEEALSSIWGQVHFSENLIIVEKVNNTTRKQKRFREEVHFQHLRKEQFFVWIFLWRKSN